MKTHNIPTINYPLNDVNKLRKCSNIGLCNSNSHSIIRQNSSHLIINNGKSTNYTRTNSECHVRLNLLNLNKKSKSYEINLNLNSN